MGGGFGQWPSWAGGLCRRRCGVVDQGGDDAGGVFGQDGPDGDLVGVLAVQGVDVEDRKQCFFNPGRGVGQDPGGGGELLEQGLNGGAFVIADFDDAATIAYQDTAVSGQIIEDASEAGALAHTWDTLRLEALPRAASLSLIEETQDNGHEPSVAQSHPQLR